MNDQPELVHGSIPGSHREDAPGTLSAKALGCLCGWYDAGDAESGPRVVASIHASCPLHGEKDPTGLGRVCAICGTTAVASKDPETDFCRLCWATGASEERDLERDGRGLLSRLRAIEGVSTASVWQTGGGCMVLAVTLADDRLVTACHPEGPEMVGPEGPWEPIISASEEAWGEWDEDRITLRPEGSAVLDDDGLVKWIESASVETRPASTLAQEIVETDGRGRPEDGLGNWR